MSETKCNGNSAAQSLGVDRRVFLLGATVAGLYGAASLTLPNWASGAAAEDVSAIQKEIEKRHDESVQRLQEWIKQPSIAAENRGMNEGCDLTMRMLRDAGFQQVTKVPTDGQPGIFATLDAGAPKTVALYFMYDVKQADPAEWSSPPFDAALVDKPGLGKVIIGRGAEARSVGALREGEVFGEMSLIEPGPRSATVKAATDVECLAMSYEEFVAAIEDHPERAVAFMKTLVRRLRQMNQLMESMGPDRRGFRGMIRDWRKSVGPAEIDRDAADLSWTMLW